MAAPGSLSPRARAILAAVEREVSARLAELEQDVAVVAPRRVVPFTRAAPELLAALELGVAARRCGATDPAPCSSSASRAATSRSTASRIALARGVSSAIYAGSLMNPFWLWVQGATVLFVLIGIVIAIVRLAG